MFIFNRFVFFLNLVCALALCLSYLAPYISPSLVWPLAFLGLAYPFLLLANILFVIYWLIFGRLKLLMSLGAIILGLGFFNKFIRFNSRHLANKEGTLHVVSFNAGMFGFYEKKKAHPPVYTYLAKEMPDIVCFQEFYSYGEGENSMTRKFKKVTGMKYHYFNVLDDGTAAGEFGLAMFSRYPVVRKGTVDLSTTTGNGCIYADLLIDKDTIRVYNVHLQSIRFMRDDYKFVQKIPTDRDTAIFKSRNILKRLKYAFIKRAEQVDKLKSSMERCPYKMIVCGDFNDPPVSYAYRSISGDLKDAFVESGSGLERTYVGPFPSFRIDHILFDPSFEGYDYKSVNNFMSDHKLIQTLIKIK